jgi:hypothetical protein
MTETPTTTSKPTVKRGSKPYIFHISSATRPGLFHVADAYRLTCSCEAGRAGRGCWHLRLALSAYEWQKKQQSSTPMKAGSQWVAPQARREAGGEGQEAQSSSAPAPVAQQTGTGELRPLWSHFE